MGKVKVRQQEGYAEKGTWWQIVERKCENPDRLYDMNGKGLDEKLNLGNTWGGGKSRVSNLDGEGLVVSFITTEAFIKVKHISWEIGAQFGTYWICDACDSSTWSFPRGLLDSSQKKEENKDEQLSQRRKLLVQKKEWGARETV